MNKVTLKWLIENVDTSKQNEGDVKWDDLANLFNIYDLYWSGSTRLKCYYLKKTYCTDTYVGSMVYMLDGEFVIYSTQSYRKSDINFIFASKEVQNKVHQYLLSLLDKEEFELDVMTDDLLNQELDDKFTVEFNSNIMGLKAHYKNEQVKIIKSDYGYHDFKSVLIELPSKQQITVKVSELKFEYCLKK